MSKETTGYTLEFNNHLTGLGQPEFEGTITKYEAMLCVEHWLKMLCAVEGNWACDKSGSWECVMWQYANCRIKTLRESGAVSIDDYQTIHASIDWPDSNTEHWHEAQIQAYVKEHAEELDPANWSSDEFLSELDNPSRSETGQEDSIRTDTNDAIDW